MYETHRAGTHLPTLALLREIKGPKGGGSFMGSDAGPSRCHKRTSYKGTVPLIDRERMNGHAAAGILGLI